MKSSSASPQPLIILYDILYPVSLTSHELLARTVVGLDSVALALASGAAALSLTTGLSSVLVGVMGGRRYSPTSCNHGDHDRCSSV